VWATDPLRVGQGPSLLPKMRGVYCLLSRTRLSRSHRCRRRCYASAPRGQSSNSERSICYLARFSAIDEGLAMRWRRRRLLGLPRGSEKWGIRRGGGGRADASANGPRGAAARRPPRDGNGQTSGATGTVTSTCPFQLYVVFTG
jgi:hypothetical protein